MLTMDDENIKRFENDLRTFKGRAYPFATKQTINNAAFHAMREYRKEAGKDMVLRNRFTVQSIRVEPARTLNVNRQEAVTGSIAPYMEDQEFGATVSKRGKVGVPIPTSVASGEGEGAQPRRRVVPRSRKLGAIRLRNEGLKARSKKQKNYLKIKFAAKSGHKFVFLDLQKHPGIYRVTGGVRRSQIKLIYDMSKSSTPIPRNPMLAPSVKTTEKLIPTFYQYALVNQLKRHGLFKG